MAIRPKSGKLRWSTWLTTMPQRVKQLRVDIVYLPYRPTMGSKYFKKTNCASNKYINC